MGVLDKNYVFIGGDLMQKIMWFVLSLLIAAAPNAPACAFTVSFGGTSGPGGVTNQGTFSSFGNTTFTTTTIDFNSATLPGGGSFSSGLATYTSSNSGATPIRTDGLAPSYTPGTTPATGGIGNTSRYLAVYTGETVTVTFSKELDYFGFDFGLTDPGNTVTFYQGNTVISTFLGSSLGGTFQSGYNVYVNFFANSNEHFTRIVFTNTSGGGFETDNHAYRQAVPEPYPLPALVGLMALGLTVKRHA
jgi:hypothetical protein